MIKIHFLNVGHGDCIVIENLHNSRNTIIDINRSSDMDGQSTSELFESFINSLDPLGKAAHSLKPFTLAQLYERNKFDSSLTDPIVYLITNKITPIFRFISTHPHMDHLSGLYEMKRRIHINGFWIVKNEFSQKESELSDTQKSDWSLYKKYRDGEKDDEHWVIRPLESQSNDFWKQDGITILSPNPEIIKLAKDQKNPNLLSYVLLINYKERKIVLGGDAEKEIWEILYKKYPDELKEILILKASHHGRDNGYHNEAVKLMKPEYTVVSVGKKPSTDASNKYRQHSKNVWSTRWQGNITFTVKDDGTVGSSSQFDR